MSEEVVVQEIALGKRLQMARQKAGLTQQQLCAKADLSYSTLAKVERGAIKAPSIFTIESIADVIGVTLDELMGRQSGAVAAGSDKKISKSGIRFVYFDINGCLVHFFHSAFTELSKKTGVPLHKVEAAFWRFNDAICRGEITFNEFNKKFAKQMDVEALDWAPYYLAAVEPIQEMHELIAWASEHYKIGLMSNIMPGMIEAMISQGIIPDAKYDSIIDSSVEHTIKPEAKVYEIAEQRAGVDPSEILLVDDTRANLMAADQKGWSVLWFDDYNTAESAKRVREILEF
jgi:FMN phosphatase YigB (HAD superfamily)/DNA-binding XRE family transcriptional regulator